MYPKTNTTQTPPPSEAAALTGAAPLTVSFSDGRDPETIHVRAVTPADILEGRYVELFTTDYAALLEWLTGKPAGWAAGLDRASWTALRELETELNFSFAFDETEAAHERGQSFKFVTEAILQKSRELVEIMASLTSSPNTAASADPLARKPSPSPSPGSPS